MPRTKVVVRDLPPELPEEAFKEAVEAAGFLGRVTWFDFVPGKPRAKLNTPSIAYLNFSNEEDVFEFSGAFAGRRFEAGPGKCC
jgi:regulator of nonsense transcripts 3